MPSFSKKALSLYLRVGCERQFRLYLYNDKERKTHLMPPREKVRAGLGQAGQAGIDWQNEKVAELESIFASGSVISAQPDKSGKVPATPLIQVLPTIGAHKFIIEGQYEVGSVFKNSLGINNLRDNYGEPLVFGDARPDIIQTFPSGTFTEGVNPDGEVFDIGTQDERTQLRVIDVKLVSEPGAHYYAEVVYYSMTLAAWLIENRLDDRFVVTSVAAVWPGKHGASELAKSFATWEKKAYSPTIQEKLNVMNEDIEIAPFDVFAPRLRRLLQFELPDLLTQPWDHLDWHVDYRCNGCEFLGYPWLNSSGLPTNDALHCWEMAKTQGHLSQIVGLTPGAVQTLMNGSVNALNIPNIATLATTNPANSIFDNHQGLRARRTVYPYRAQTLQSGNSSLIPFSGTSAIMPKWVDLRIYIMLDYDLSSAITSVIALRASWFEPFLVDATLQRARKAWGVSSSDKRVFPVDQRDVKREQQEFIKFLIQIKEILDEIRKIDDADIASNRRTKPHRSKYQIYLWDDAQFTHLTRLMSRHLNAIIGNPKLRDLAWLFPPQELLPNPEDATRQSPITLVSDVIENHVAIPLPHHYTLLEVAKHYKKPAAPSISIHPLYQDPLSNLIPAERIHEWWNRRGDFNQTQERIIEAAYKKALDLSIVVDRLEEDLRPTLSDQSAPLVHNTPDRLKGVAPHSQLWYQFTRLNAELQNLEKQTTRALPSHEREARLKSARLRKRLTGQAAKNALNQINQTSGTNLQFAIDLYIYEMRPASREVNFKVGDFTLALSPESQSDFLDKKVWQLVKNTPLDNNPDWQSLKSSRASTITGVVLEAIDRENGFIALRASSRCRIDDLERHNIADFSKHVVLDEMEIDILSEKVRLTLKALKTPVAATGDALTYQALNMIPKIPTAAQSKKVDSPAVDFLWKAPNTHQQHVQRSLTNIETQIKGFGIDLNSSQWDAWHKALSRRLSLIWGPPGTGKSKTIRAIAFGAVLDALENHKPLRLLITANTYNAVDNVLLELEVELRKHLSNKPYGIYRLQSTQHVTNPKFAVEHPNLQCLEIDRRDPSPQVEQLRSQLEANEGIVIIGAPVQQPHNLATARLAADPLIKDTLREWFDLILLDEASQIDVASSTLIFSKAAINATCVLAGDDLQLPPIHQADPPEGLESLLGSVFNFMVTKRNYPVVQSEGGNNGSP